MSMVRAVKARNSMGREAMVSTGNRKLQRRQANTWFARGDGVKKAAINPPIHSFARLPINALPVGTVQTKLTLGRPDDRYEQEADAVADHVMRMPDPRAASVAGMMNTTAFVVGNNITLGARQDTPDTRQGRHRIAHELTHVLQQNGRGASPTIQRRVVDDDAHVTCRGVRADGVRALQNAEGSAINLGRRAARDIRVYTALYPFAAVLGESASLRRFRDVLWRRFHLDYTQARVRERTLPLLARRYELAADWISRLNHRYICAAAGTEPPGACTNRPGESYAWTATGVNRTALCDDFWDDLDDDGKAETILHEWLHFGFGWLGDCDVSNRNNTICFEMFAAELAGTATAVNYSTCCAPPTGALPPMTGAGP